jgi:asparagine synthase (glutamine-hydrolysing)
VLKRQPGVQRHFDWVTGGRAAVRDGLYGPRLDAGYDASSMAAVLDGLGAHGDPQTVRAFMLLDQVMWLPDDVLAKADRASMLASLEVRTPFLEPTLAAFAASIPGRRHVTGGGKRLLRAVLAKRLPTMRRGRAKTAFRVPADQWLRGPLAGVMREQIEDGRLYADGWIDRHAARRVFDDHLAGTRDGTGVLWPLMVLGFWVERLGEVSAA